MSSEGIMPTDTTSSSNNVTIAHEEETTTTTTTSSTTTIPQVVSIGSLKEFTYHITNTS
jgi:hypothetical protein